IAICFRASRDQRSSVGDQEIKLFEVYNIEHPEHLFGEENEGESEVTEEKTPPPPLESRARTWLYFDNCKSEPDPPTNE
ncbi:hypothetical protein ACJX0J_039060, partial [Zea mays]